MPQRRGTPGHTLPTTRDNWRISMMRSVSRSIRCFSTTSEGARATAWTGDANRCVKKRRRRVTPGCEAYAAFAPWRTCLVSCSKAPWRAIVPMR
eukprot:11596997-Prorocentrum_lima.AAC.1